MGSQDTIQRVRFFDRQLLQVKDFTDEQSYHIRMRRLHNRFLHSYGVLDGLELQLDPHGRKLTVEEGIALDEQGREIVLPHQEPAIDLGPYAGKTLYVTIGYAERDVAPGAAPGAQGFPRVEEYPQVVLTETPPRAGEVLILGRVVVGDDGAATAQDDGVLPFQRRNSGGAGGDLEGRTLTLSGAGSATEWPRLRMSESRTAALEAGLRVSGDLRVAGRASVAVELGVGTDTPRARLHVQHVPQDSDGDALVVGPVEGANLRLGHHHNYSWMQSHGSKPLRINEIGNDVSIAGGGNGRVGIGTHEPAQALHVASASDDVGLFQSRGSSASVSLATRDGMDHHVQVANRAGGRLSLWVSGGGDVVNVTRDGRVGVGTEYPAGRFHVRADDRVGLFESIGEHAYLRLATREGDASGVQLAAHPGGRLALGTADAADAVSVTRDGQVGIGTAEPQARLHVAGDLVVDGEIRSLQGQDQAQRWTARPNGLVFEGAVGIGTVDPEAKLQVIHTPQDSNGDALVLGPEGASNLRMGYHADYSWIQSHGSRPLRINELGNDLVLNLGGGNVGIGTASPIARLQVAGGAIMPSAGNDEQSGILFPPDAGGGAADRAWMRYYARSGEAMTLELGIGNDADDHLALMPVGNVGIGVNAPTHRLHVRGTDPIALFESTGKMAYIRLAANGRIEDRVELCNRGDGQLALWVPGGNDALVIGNDGRMVLGSGQNPTARVKPLGDIDLRGDTVFTGRDGNPGAKVRILGDVVVEGSIRTPKGELVPGGGGAPAAVAGNTLQVPQMLTVGPTAIEEAEGRLHLSGKVAELSLMDRTTPVNGNKAGQRYVWYVNEGRARIWTQERGDLFSVNRDGGVAVGPNAAGDDRLEVHGRVRMLTDSNPIRFTAGWTGFPDAVLNQAEISNDTGDYKTLMIVGNRARGDGKRTVGIWDHLNVNGTMEVTQNVVIKGALTVEGGLKVGGPKGGYLADQFVNLTGDTLEEGDVVVIGESQATLFYGERGNIPIPEVDLTEMVMDRRVCGIVAQAHDGDESEGMEPVSTARKRRGTGAETDPAESSDDPRQVAAGQRGMMVTMGAFAHCKVDADLGAINVGDLLTTSSTKGHAQKVDDPSQASGAIVGKALASLKKGRGKIPVMVMLH